MLKLRVKFVNDLPQTAREELCAGLYAAGAIDVHAFFPGEPDEDLAGLYVVEYAVPDDEARLAAWLRSRTEVAFVDTQLPSAPKALRAPKGVTEP